MMEPAQIAPQAFGDATIGESAKVALEAMSPAPAPVWYQTPVATIPLAAAAFIIGNVLLMLRWPG
jgi:hypothetical protein